MKTILFLFVFHIISEITCNNETSKGNSTSTEDGGSGTEENLVFFPSDDVFKGLDPKTFAIQLSDEHHTKGYVCPQTSGNFPWNFDCRSFYMCTDGQVKHLQCLPEYAFDSSEGYCCPRKQVWSCYHTHIIRKQMKPSSNSSAFACTDDGAYSNPEDCSSFYICANRKTLQFQCPHNTKFDKNSKTCLPSKLATCMHSSKSKHTKKPLWIPQALGSIPHSESDLIAQESVYSSFVVYH